MNQVYRIFRAYLRYLLIGNFHLFMAVDIKGCEWVWVRTDNLRRAWELIKYYRALGYKE